MNQKENRDDGIAKADVAATTKLILQSTGNESAARILEMKAPRLTIDDLDRILYVAVSDSEKVNELIKSL